MTISELGRRQSYLKWRISGWTYWVLWFASWFLGKNPNWLRGEIVKLFPRSQVGPFPRRIRFFEPSAPAPLLREPSRTLIRTSNCPRASGETSDESGACSLASAPTLSAPHLRPIWFSLGYFWRPAHPFSTPSVWSMSWSFSWIGHWPNYQIRKNKKRPYSRKYLLSQPSLSQLYCTSANRYAGWTHPVPTGNTTDCSIAGCKHAPVCESEALAIPPIFSHFAWTSKAPSSSY